MSLPQLLAGCVVLVTGDRRAGDLRAALDQQAVHALVAACNSASTPGRRPTAHVTRVTGETISRMPRGVTATGVAFAVFCVWGFAESYADAPHAPGWLIYPLFWAAFGVVSPFVRTSR